MNVIVQGGLVDLIPMNVMVQGGLVDLMNVIVQGGLVDLIPMNVMVQGVLVDLIPMNLILPLAPSRPLLCSGPLPPPLAPRSKSL